MSGNPPRKVTGRSFLRLPSARVAIVVLLGIAVLTVFGSTLAPQNPLTINANALFQGPSVHHWLGTDYLGRDVLSRLMVGTRLSVLTALEAVGILLAPFFFRITRAATLEHSRAQYVEAAELMGASKLHVVRVHVLRKVLPTIAVTTASMTAAALLAVSFLTFLGIGVQPPAPTWGGVLSSDLDYLNQAPWAPFIPAALIAITIGALNALADAFRDRRGAGALAAQPDPIIRTHSTLEPADDDRQSQVA